jgi:hypothetical protein
MAWPTVNINASVFSSDSSTISDSRSELAQMANNLNSIKSTPVVESNTTGISGADRVTNVVALTEAEYAAITPNATTFYIIVE